jgi:hypothetical protein
VLVSFKVVVIDVDSEDVIKELLFYWLVSNMENNIQVNYIVYGINLIVPVILYFRNCKPKPHILLHRFHGTHVSKGSAERSCCRYTVRTKRKSR